MFCDLNSPRLCVVEEEIPVRVRAWNVSDCCGDSVCLLLVSYCSSLRKGLRIAVCRGESSLGLQSLGKEEPTESIAAKPNAADP